MWSDQARAADDEGVPGGVGHGGARPGTRAGLSGGSADSADDDVDPPTRIVLPASEPGAEESSATGPAEPAGAATVPSDDVDPATTVLPPVPPAAPRARQPEPAPATPAPSTPPAPTGSAASTEHPAGRRWPLLVGGAAVLAVSGIGGYALVAAFRHDDSPPDPAWCAAVEESGHRAGDGPGSADDPLGVVLAFDHAYYVDRDAPAALALTAPSARMSADALAAAIAAVPAGTAHCVDVRSAAAPEASPQSLAVTLTERAPDGAQRQIRQDVEVARGADGWVITAVTPAG